MLCSENKLEKLNLKNNSKLQRIECDNGELSGKGLLLGNKPVLDKLICSNNNLTEIDISGCTKLSLLQCNNNKITSLDLSSNKELSEFNCSNNPLSGLSLDNVKFLYTLLCTD